MKLLLIATLLTIVSCSGAKVKQEKREYVKSFGTLINKGSLEYSINVNEMMIINENINSKNWRVSLGKRDFKNAIIEKYENNSQKSIRFTKIGTYQVKLGSHRSKVQGAIMMQTITIIVK